MATTRPERIPGLKDTDWVYKAFMIKKEDLHDIAREYTVFSSASISAMDTSIGGHPTLNPPPGFTPTADLRTGILLNRDVQRTALDTKTIHVFSRSQMLDKIQTDGIGRYYHEAINENMQTISLQFGRPRFLGFIPFFLRFYDGSAAATARDGRGPSFFFQVGNFTGSAVLAAAKITLLVSMMAHIPFSVVLPLTAMGMFLFSRPTSSFYSLEPTMGAYWSRVNFILNTMAVNRNLIGRRSPVGGSTATGQMDDDADPEIPEYFQQASKLAPTIFHPDSYVDAYAIARRYGMYMHARREYIRSKLTDFEFDSSSQGLSPSYQKLKKIMMQKAVVSAKTENISDYLDRYFKGVWGSAEYRANDAFSETLANYTPENADPNAAPPPSPDGTNDTQLAQDSNAQQGDIPVPANTRRVFIKNPNFGKEGAEAGEPEQTIMGSIIDTIKQAGNSDMFAADLRQANSWISLYVSNSGSISESFSSQYQDAEISQTLNGVASSARNARFNFSGGKTGISMIDAPITAVLDTLKGVANGVGLGGLLGITGGSFVHIPKQYSQSSTSFPTLNLSLELRSPYGDQLSQFLNLDIPVAILLAAALPITNGTQSYSDPFYCTMFSRGRMIGRMMAIDSLQITRGVGNLGFNSEHRSLGVDVSVSFADMNNIMHAPISTGFNPLKPWGLLFDDDSAFKDYLGAMANMSLADQTEFTRKMSLNLSRQMANFNSYFSWSHVSASVNDLSVTRLVGKAASLAFGSDQAALALL